jgi:hypothetical protein
MSNGGINILFGCVVEELFTVPTPTNAAAWAITVLEDHQQHGRGVGAVHA